VKSPTTLLLLLGLGHLAACSQHSDPAPESQSPSESRAPRTLEAAQLGQIAQLHVFDGIYLAGQPEPQDFALAKEAGVRTVLNIRHPAELGDFDEEAHVIGLGLEYVSLPWGKPEELTDEVFDRYRELLEDSERPVLLHCGSANRVGAVWIPWRVLDGGLSFEAALEEAKTIGLRTPAYEERAAAYVREHGG